jgi:AcrR family transcriptional regulator
MRVPASSRDQPLTRDEIVQAALAVTERDGLDRLTMRSVASKLGVSAMALYHYVADKGELVRLIGEAVSSKRVPLRRDDDSWENALRRHLLSTWEETTRYPGVSEYLMGTPGIGATPTSVSQGVGFFEEVGFPPRLARLAWSCSVNYIHGRLSVESRLHGPQGRSVRSAWIGGLPARDYVEFGVEVMIAGLRTMLDSATEGVQQTALFPVAIPHDAEQYQAPGR